MIVVVGRVRTDDEKRERMLEVAQTVARASRAEAGCINYRVYEDTEEPNDFVFVEEWADDTALQAHFGTPHIAQFMGAITEAIVGPPDVNFHQIASSRSLADVADVTAG
jgi:quinol monooxygenase YgiN